MKAIAKIGIVVMGLGVGAFIALLPRFKESPEWDGKAIPKEGLVLNPEGKNLGDPENAAGDFKRVYAAMDAYRRANGKLPTLQELTDFKSPLAQGFQLSAEDLTTPDGKYADGYVPGQQNLSYMFAFIQPRPNGKERPAFPAAGERDVWLVSTDYVRRNQRMHQDKHSDIDFRGVYVVLWSDGKIEKVPVDGVVFASASAKSFGLNFPGQAGLPKGSKGLAEIYSGERKGKNNVKINGA
ncbi:MAG: hypothetical protein EON58_12540 [Alphaproteobacteria bacterium]|nr:MAG: hypothetical protein EON58_12540 [Alphaproteobacteria bacterium]